MIYKNKTWYLSPNEIKKLFNEFLRFGLYPSYGCTHYVFLTREEISYFGKYIDDLFKTHDANTSIGFSELMEKAYKKWIDKNHI